jgi:cell division protease FtsH
VVLAATNRPEILDPALLRAGRFDRQVVVDRPDKAGRLAILKVHVKRIRLAPDVDLEKVAAMTTGFAGADLANLVNEAAIQATRRKAEAVTMSDFTAAFERLVAGAERKSRTLDERERRVVAYHEIGHALVARALPGSDPVHKISIIPRGVGALGYTLQRPSEDRYLLTREDLERRIMVLLGGRAAEVLVFGHLSTGAADDLARATQIARDMVTRYGMDETLGFVAFETQRPRFLEGAVPPDQALAAVSEAVREQIDAAVRRIVMNAFECTLAILRANRAQLEAAAQQLLTKETLEEPEVEALLRDLVVPACVKEGNAKDGATLAPSEDAPFARKEAAN